MPRVQFALTLFVSATLLFLIQPIIAKTILPLLGGAPAVWITCMVFFQAMLLAGYLYAHAITQRLGARRQMLIHLGLLLLAIASLPLLNLPLHLARGEPHALDIGLPPTQANPTLWLLALLALSVGPPFFVVASSSPLLQQWFTRTGDSAAGDPYFLYAASNLGSLLALLGYPTLLEPFVHLPSQGWIWKSGYLALVALTAVCARMIWRAPAVIAVESVAAGSSLRDNRRLKPAATKTSEPVAVAEVTLSRRLRWLALAFVPSSLLLGVTTVISTDIAAIPLLWVVPLALYLLSFILVFARRQWLPHRWMVRALPVLILCQLFWALQQAQPVGTSIALQLSTFFVVAMVCHGELARDRPSPRHLTEFYLWLAAGGVLGGLFNALVAPLLFSSVAESPLQLVLACLFQPKPALGQPAAKTDLRHIGLPLILGLTAALVTILMGIFVTNAGLIEAVLALAIPVLCYVAAVYLTDRPLLFGASVGTVLLLGFADITLPGQMLLRQRTFFGIHRVIVNPNGPYIELHHGSTLHGRQHYDTERGVPIRPDVPLGYYHRQGPIGHVFDTFSGPAAKDRVAVIGLGAGSLAAYGHKGQDLTFYEIDAAVRDLASNPRYFTFLSASPAKVQVVMGDGRLALAGADDRAFGLIVVDAFSGDAIPVHLLTREALRDVYLRKLARDGLLAFHISNRYLDLRPVLGDLAQDAGLVCRVEDDLGDEPSGRAPSVWVIMTREERHLGRLAADSRWRKLPGRPGAAVWTDDFSNVLGIVRWR